MVPSPVKTFVFLAPHPVSGAATDWTSASTYDTDELVSENPLESHVAAEDLQVRVTDAGPQHLNESLPGGSSRDPRSRVQHRPALRARPQRQHPRSNLTTKRLRACSQPAKAEAQTKKIKEQWQTSKEIFAFASTFAWCELDLWVYSHQAKARKIKEM